MLFGQRTHSIPVTQVDDFMLHLFFEELTWLVSCFRISSCVLVLTDKRSSRILTDLKLYLLISNSNNERSETQWVFWKESFSVHETVSPGVNFPSHAVFVVVFLPLLTDDLLMCMPCLAFLAFCVFVYLFAEPFALCMQQHYSLLSSFFFHPLFLSSG